MSAFDSCASLPCYTPSLPAPSYSCQLSCGEQSLLHTPRPRLLEPPPTSAFIKKVGKTTVVLENQEENADIPTYGRHDNIHGSLLFEDCESISEVRIKIEAKIDSTTSESGSTSQKLIHDSYTLWSDETSQNTCPSSIPFSMTLPTTYNDGKENRSLPPSFLASYISVPTLFMKITYRIHAIITRQRKVGFLTKSKQYASSVLQIPGNYLSDSESSIVIPFNYYPRTRSHRPIIASPCFFSSVKSSPEEWYQSVTQAKMRPTCKMDPITCSLFIPAARIYGITDAIPFHVQLSGRLSSLREIFPPESLERIMSSDSHRTTQSTKINHRQTVPIVRVFILRQITIEGYRGKSWRNSIIGEGTICPMPPSPSTTYRAPSDLREEHIDWEGELRLKDDVKVGGFDAGFAQVKDFVTMKLSPDPFSSKLLETQLTIPVRFVTESWTDTSGLDGSV